MRHKEKADEGIILHGLTLGYVMSAQQIAKDVHLEMGMSPSRMYATLF